MRNETTEPSAVWDIWTDDGGEPSPITGPRRDLRESISKALASWALILGNEDMRRLSKTLKANTEEAAELQKQNYPS